MVRGIAHQSRKLVYLDILFYPPVDFVQNPLNPLFLIHLLSTLPRSGDIMIAYILPGGFSDLGKTEMQPMNYLHTSEGIRTNWMMSF